MEAIKYNEMRELARRIAEMVREDLRAEALQPKWINIPQAAEYAGVKSRNTILRWIKNADIYAVKKPGSNWIIDRESIDAFLGNERMGL